MTKEIKWLVCYKPLSDTENWWAEMLVTAPPDRLEAILKSARLLKKCDGQITSLEPYDPKKDAQ